MVQIFKMFIKKYYLLLLTPLTQNHQTQHYKWHDFGRNPSWKKLQDNKPESNNFKSTELKGYLNCFNEHYYFHSTNFRYIEEHIQKTGVAIETQGVTFVTSGKKRETFTVGWSFVTVLIMAMNLLVSCSR